MRIPFEIEIVRIVVALNGNHAGWHLEKKSGRWGDRKKKKEKEK